VLRASGAEHVVIEHEPIRTQADVDRVLSLPAERRLKTMVFRGPDDRFFLVALLESRRVSYPLLSRAVGVPRARLRQADAADLAELGMEPGGASPVCGADCVTVVFDAGTDRMGRVYCGSGRPDRTVEIDAAALIALVRPTVAEVTQDGA
jgi:Cys-tRNA(Pro)/Cys-tRNA(Cys) deacylase